MPAVFLLNWLYTPAITFVLILGGFYLAFEGVEKIIEFIFHHQKKGHEVIAETEKADNPADAEKSKIKSAVTTDFILSVEIVIIALGTVLEGNYPLLTQIISVSVVAMIATVGVYGIVALIVRMDDAGYNLIKKSDGKGFLFALGNGLVSALPVIIKLLSVVGTLALLLVSGGIFSHNIDFLHHLLPNIPATLKEFGIGLIAGLLAVAVFTIVKKSTGALKTN